jgi:SAM-dependent methyltransferase
MATAPAARPADDWSAYLASDYRFTDFPRGARVLDIGFGRGEEMRAVERSGARAFGVEYDGRRAALAAAAGLRVCRGSAEQLPFLTACVDGVVCKVVLMLTDEAQSVRELARVLRPGGTAHICYHGLGYSLRYVCCDPDWKRRVYGLRTILNTVIYRVTGARLPGFWGDTLFQSTRQLQQYYRDAGLELVVEHPSPRFAGRAVFIYHTLRKASASVAAVESSFSADAMPVSDAEGSRDDRPTVTGSAPRSILASVAGADTTASQGPRPPAS